MQNGIFVNSEPGKGMGYTDHEKQVKNALIDHKDYSRKTLYLFFMTGKTAFSAKGYMPFNKKFGFIYRNKQEIQEIIRTIAHELGHGAFRLRHPSSPECPYPQPEGQTNNLMDYVDAGKALQALALHKYQWDEVHDFDLGLNWFEDAEEAAMLSGCKPPKPSEPSGEDRVEGKFATTSCQTSSISHGEQLTATRTQIWYYHLEDKPYTACCDDNGKYVTVQPEYKTGWYTEEQYCEEVIKPILVSFGILNGNVTVLSTNQESRKISAGYNLEQFFKDRPVSDDLLKTLETSYYPQICKDATNMLSGSGRIDPVNIEFDLILTFTGVGEARALLSYLRAKSFAKSTKLFASRTGKGVELLAREGGEKVALYADNALKEIKYIDEGGEILGSTGKIKVIETDGSKVESVLQIVGKDGRIGFRKTITQTFDDLAALFKTKPAELLQKLTKTEVKVANKVTKSAKAANLETELDHLQSLTANLENFRPPYKKGSFVDEFELADDVYFVRVYDNPNYEAGRWMMKIEDFKALGNDANKIKDIFALPSKPTKYSVVKVPAGTKIRTGTAAKVWDNTYKWGNGGGTQFEILDWINISVKDKTSWFKKIGDL